MRRALGKGGGDLRAHGELQVPDGDGGVAARGQQAGDRRVSIAAAQAAAAAAAAAAVTLTSGKTGDGEPIIHHSTDRVRRLLLAYPSCGHSSSSLSRAAGTRRRRRHSLLFFLRPPRSTRGVGAAAAARPPACARRSVPPPLGRRLMLAVERPRCWSRRRSTSVGRNRARAQQQRAAGSVSGEQGGRATTNERGRCRAQQCPALSSSCDGRAPLLRGIDRCSRSVARQRQLSGRDSVAAAGVLQQPAGEPAGCLAACRPAVPLRRSPVQRAAEVERAG